MERVDKRLEPEGRGGTHSDATKPLPAFRRIVVSCNDCGDATVLEEPQLADLTAVPTFGDLWRLAFCATCRANGGTGPANVDLRGELAKAVAYAEPVWSTERVFDDDRSDPFPKLPRRPLFSR